MGADYAKMYWNCTVWSERYVRVVSSIDHVWITKAMCERCLLCYTAQLCAIHFIIQKNESD